MPPSRPAEALTLDREGPESRGSRAETRHAVRNEILRALPPEELSQVISRAELVSLKPRQVLIEPNLSVMYGYFVESGVASILAGASERKPMEVGLVGRFGFVGIPLVLGTGRTPLRCMVQIKGSAWRVSADDLEVLLRECPSLVRLLMAHIQGRMTQQALLNVCNATHSVPERICRWLLIARDRLRSDHIPATHDLIARMLGVRRPGVTDALGNLEKMGVVQLTRGTVEIRQLRALEQRACRCLHRIDSEYERLISDATGATTL